MKENKILGISILPETKSTVLDKILLYISKPTGFFHIVSLNPENMVLTTENNLFKRVVETAQMKIVDGVGIVLAGRWLNVDVGERVPGVELVEELIKIASKRRLRVLMIGGRENLALELAKCYSNKFSEGKFKGIQGVTNIQNPSKVEEDAIFSIVATYKPHLIFVAFGSPYQELWIERHKKKFIDMIVMGVGGSFDYLSGKVTRPPVFIQKIGLEWLFRLLQQPWRWKRQLRLIKFVILLFTRRFWRCRDFV